MKRIKSYIEREKNLSILFGVLLLVIVVFAFVFGNKMYSARNLRSMAYQIPEFGFLALGMMLSFMLGGIDLSIVAIANTSGIFAAMIMMGRWFPGLAEGTAIPLAILVAMLSATLFGMFNGFLIAKLSATPLIATLGTMTLYTGIGMALTSGTGITGLPASFAAFGTAELAGVPVIFLLFAVAAVALGLVLGCTGFGRKLYLYGENPIASRFSAINNEGMCLGVFTLIGVLSGISGLIIISRVNSAKVGYGDTYQLQAMLVCVIGGIHPAGGRGKTAGVACAILLMQLLSSAFTILRSSPYAKKLIWGSILIIVMGLNYLSDLRVRRMRLKAALKT